jgi:hypothetical protein
MRSGLVLGVVAALLCVGVAGASGQTSEEMIAAIKRPISPENKALLARADEQVNKCFDAAVPRVAEKYRSNGDITSAACKACDKVLTEYSKAYFEANRERYLTMTLDQAIQSQKDYCSIGKSDRVESARQKFAAEIVENVKYISFNEWSVEGRTDRSGLLSYVLIASSDNPAIRLELICAPAKHTMYDRLFGPFRTARNEYLTFVVDGGAAMKQISATIQATGRADIVDHLPVALAKSTLRVAIQGQSATFNMSGYPAAYRNWSSRCL